MTQDELKHWYRIWKQYKVAYTNRPGHRLDRLGNRIEFRLTFEEWLDIWVKSGHLHERGRKKGQYNLCRIDDIGHYEVGNVYVASNAHNLREMMSHRPPQVVKEEVRQQIALSLQGIKHTAERRANISKAQMKPCTVDGITIYPSKNDLIAALGQGRNGSRSPSFRFV